VLAVADFTKASGSDGSSARPQSHGSPTTRCGEGRRRGEGRARRLGRRACGRRHGEGQRVRAAARRGAGARAGGGTAGDRQRGFKSSDQGRGFRGPGCFNFMGLTEADENSGYFRGPGPWPTKIFHMFVGQEADENNCRIFVGRPTKIFWPTKIYVFPVVTRAWLIVLTHDSTTLSIEDKIPAQQ
jgi:hypothetical protein